MGSPQVLVELELLPLNPSSYNAQPVCINRNSHPMAQYKAQTAFHMSKGDPIAQSVRTGACIDVNQVPSSSESEDELANEEAPFITKASAKGQKRTSSDPKSGPTHPEPTKVSYFEQERTLDDVSLHESEDEGGGVIARKKLRLSKEKSALLEERFKEHSTLNPNQKIALAKQLNLRPRQVEVWFQNRRARTKLKQIEVDCEVLKRCCETLSEENRRLQKEIVELRALTMGGQCVIPHDFCMPFPGITLTMCPSCERLGPQPVVAQATSTTTSISSFNQPSIIPLTFSSHQQQSPACS